MARIKEEKTASRRPGKCVVTGSSDGPFLTTGRTLPQWGTVYLSVPAMTPLLRDAGFIPEDEVKELKEENKELRSQVEQLKAVEADHQELVDAVSQYIEVEPEVHEVETLVSRDPTDEEIEKWIAKHGGNHPAVRQAQPLEKGSTEEWNKLYGDTKVGQPKSSPPKAVDGREPALPAGEGEDDEGQYYELHDQKIDLDEVLSHNVGEVVTYAEDKDDAFQEALVRREFVLKEGDPRKGVLEPLGYWDEDEDAAIHPDEVLVVEEEKESDEETLTLDEDEDEDE